MPDPLRLLILEDRPSDAELILAELRAAGFEPDWKRVDTEADFLVALDPSLHLIIADYHLPQFDGVRALKLMQARGLEIPFILVSGTIGEEIAVQAMKVGAADYLLKDRLARLGEAVRRALKDWDLHKENRRALQRLRESEDRYRDLVENSSDLICIHDMQGLLLSANPAACRKLGYELDELIGRNLREFLAPEVQGHFKYYLQRLNRQGSASGLLIAQTKSGERRIWEYHNTLRTQGVKQPMVRGRAQDVTERKQAEQNLREAETSFRTLVEQVPAITYRAALDSSKTRTYISPQVESMLGYSQAESLEDPDLWRRMLHPGDFERVIADSKKFYETEEPFACEYRLQTRHGDIVWVHDQAVIVRDQDGRPLFIQGIQMDITERKQAEEALRESEEQNRTLVEHLPTVVYTNALDNATSTLYISPQIQTLLGYSPEEWVADPTLWSKTLHPEDLTLALKQAFYTEESQEPFEMDYRMIARDGHLVWVHDQIVLVHDLEGRPKFWQGIMLDITDRKEAETSLRKSLEETARANRILQVLSLAAQAAQRGHSPQDIYQAVGDAIKRLGFNIVILGVDLEKQEISLAFTNQSPKLMHAAEKLLGLSSKTYRIPLTKGGFYDRYLLADTAQIFFNVAAVVAETLPPQLRIFAKQVVNLIGIEQGIYASLKVGGKPQSIMIVSGGDLSEADVPAINILATEISIALENAILIENLQTSNTELTQAYDATIEGWSAALDLRDKETEGHSQRVTDLTIQLARSMGIGEPELTEFRRGALLHDIGKLGVPDHILFKADKLTDEEWEIMRRHPAYAYEMLSSITYLKSALEIPYCHHEKWDGSGYPRGLKGEDIPLSARIFAIVDVWDALRSDRPYRAGWPNEKIREYIVEQSDRHFDPRVVDAFIRMLNEENSWESGSEGLA